VILKYFTKLSKSSWLDIRVGIGSVPEHDFQFLAAQFEMVQEEEDQGVAFFCFGCSKKN